VGSIRHCLGPSLVLERLMILDVELDAAGLIGSAS